MDDVAPSSPPLLSGRQVAALAVALVGLGLMIVAWALLTRPHTVSFGDTVRPAEECAAPAEDPDSTLRYVGEECDPGRTRAVALAVMYGLPGTVLLSWGGCAAVVLRSRRDEVAA